MKVKIAILFAFLAIVSVLGQSEIDTSLVQFVGEFSEHT
jgi:hypothetical protein